MYLDHDGLQTDTDAMKNKTLLSVEHTRNLMWPNKDFVQVTVRLDIQPL